MIQLLLPWPRPSIVKSKFAESKIIIAFNYWVSYSFLITGVTLAFLLVLPIAARRSVDIPHNFDQRRSLNK